MEVDLESDDEKEEIEVFEPKFGEQDIAIQIVDLHKRYRTFYKSEVVLNGLNLNCPAGKFYILYGTGKSGKSALVKSILNVETFTRGGIAIFNKDVSDSDLKIGYMPQLIGLDPCLTTMETIHYFAILQNIDEHECVKNFSVLQSPMTINNYNILVSTLNADQKKVLSFYIAIMGSPQLVILDQPIAGCDPLYKNFFWKKLRGMVDNEKTTVFMTCSDEIDVKHADIFGYLKNGQIIVEEPPADLMKRYNIWSFNDLIFSVTVSELKEFQIVDVKSTPKNKDSASISSGGFDITHFTSTDDEQGIIKEKVNFDGSFGMAKISRPFLETFKLEDVLRQVWALIKWQMVTSFRNYFNLIYNLLLPVLCILFYAYCVGSDIHEVKLGVVHCGNSNKTVCLNDDNPICVLEDRINKSYLTKIYYDDYDAAEKDASNGKIHAVLLLNENEHQNSTYNKKHGCSSTALETTNIVLELDPASKLIRSHIIDQVARAYGSSSSGDYPLIQTLSKRSGRNNDDCLRHCPVTPFISNFKSFKSNDPPKDESEVALLIWGAIAVITHFSGALIGALPLCVQNRNGILDRMIMMGIRKVKLQFVHWVTKTSFVIVQTIVILVSAILYVREEFSAYRFFVGWSAILLMTLCGFSFGILLFEFLRKRVRIVLYLVILELIVSSMSGFFWTYHGLSPVFQKVTIVLPHFSVSRLLYKVVIQDISVAEDHIWIGLISPVFWMISSCIIHWVFVELNK